MESCFSFTKYNENHILDIWHISVYSTYIDDYSLRFLILSTMQAMIDTHTPPLSLQYPDLHLQAFMQGWNKDNKSSF